MTRKITRGMGRIRYGQQRKIFLGNLDARRDWGHAADYVRAMWMMLQHSEPDDFVIATGESYSVRDFLDEPGRRAGVDWTRHVEVDPRYYRPAEVNVLEGDASKARRVLGRKPETDFRALVYSMVKSDLELARREKTLIGAGHQVSDRSDLSYA